MLANVQINLAKGYEEGMENCNLNSGGREEICKMDWKFTMKWRMVFKTDGRLKEQIGSMISYACVL